MSLPLILSAHCLYVLLYPAHTLHTGIPKENIKIQEPTFLGTCLKDVVVLAPLQKATTSPLATNLTLHEYDAGHWVQVEAKDELNRDLLAWIKAL